MPHICGIQRLYILVLIIGSLHHAGSTQTVTYQQRESAVLSFNFSFISGPEDLDVSLLKMESIDGVTKHSVICAFKQGVCVYPTDHYKNRTLVLTDLSNGKLYLILKDVKKEDEGNYKCQAANTVDHGEMVIRLIVTNPVKPLFVLKAEEDLVTFQAYYSSPHDEFIWKIGPNKLMELNENESHDYRLSDRANASFHSGNVTKRDLEESDSGLYRENILNEGRYHKTQFILKVTYKAEKSYLVPLIIMIIINVILSLFIIWTKRRSLRSWWSRKSQDNSETPQKVTLREENRSDARKKPNENPVTTCDTVNEMEIKDLLENEDTERERNNDLNNE